MTSKEQLEKRIWPMTKILTAAKECFLYSYYFHRPSTEEESEFLSQSIDFDFIKHALWRVTIIELSKLLNTSNNDSFNIFYFIKDLKKLRNSNHNKEIIKNLETQLTNNELIKNIKELRDNVYAHTTSKKEDYTKINMSFKEIEEVIKIVENIIKLFRPGADLEQPTFDKNRLSITIKLLAAAVKEEQRKRDEELLYDLRINKTF